VQGAAPLVGRSRLSARSIKGSRSVKGSAVSRAPQCKGARGAKFEDRRFKTAVLRTS